MKKIFLPLLLISMTSVAHADFRANSAYTCFYSDYNDKKQFFFCGNQGNDCIGKSSSKHVRTNLFHGEKFSAPQDGSRIFWCCNGTANSAGKFIEATGWRKEKFTTSEIITVELENGTCNYERITDACGNILSDTPCTEPDNCSAGYVLRNDLCVKPCESTYAFESPSSNKCIECLTTEYQGISKKNECIKCDPEIAFFDKSKQACVNKRDMKQVSKNVMKNCFRCPDNTTFKDCVTVLSTTTAQNVANFNQLEILAKTSEQMKTYLDRMNSSLKSCHISKTAVLNGEEDIYEE